jgi:hypothetical protein
MLLALGCFRFFKGFNFLKPAFPPRASVGVALLCPQFMDDNKSWLFYVEWIPAFSLYRYAPAQPGAVIAHCVPIFGTAV